MHSVQTQPAPKMSVRQALKTIACELINANRIRLAELELRRQELSLFRNLATQIEASAKTAQAAAQAGPQMETLLSALVGRFVGPDPNRADRIHSAPPPAAEPAPVERESNGVRVTGEATQQ